MWKVAEDILNQLKDFYINIENYIYRKEASDFVKELETYINRKSMSINEFNNFLNRLYNWADQGNEISGMKSKLCLVITD